MKAIVVRAGVVNTTRGCHSDPRCGGVGCRLTVRSGDIADVKALANVLDFVVDGTPPGVVHSEHTQSSVEVLQVEGP